MALMLCLVSIGLMGCKNHIVESEVEDTTGKTISTATANCLVNLTCSGSDAPQLVNVLIADAKGNQVGSGNYYGSYYVPYDGTMIIKFKYKTSSNNYSNAEYSFNVGSMHETTVDLYAYYTSSTSYYYISIGGKLVYSSRNN